MEEVYNKFKFIRPDWFGVNYRKRREPGKYCRIHDVCEQLQEDLGLLKRNQNNTCDQQDIENGEESHKQNQNQNQNRERKRNNEEEEERNHYLNTSSERNPWGMAINVGDKFDIPTLLYSSSRDYLIRNNGDKVIFCSLIYILITFMNTIIVYQFQLEFFISILVYVVLYIVYLTNSTLLCSGWYSYLCLASLIN